MEKKEKRKDLSDLIFKILLVFTLIFFVYSIIKSPFANFSLTENKLRKPVVKQNKEEKKPIPGPLKWHDSFKGISNNPQKEEEKGKFFK